MTSLLERSRRTGIALVLALGLAILPGIVIPLLGNELANSIIGVTVVLADEPQGSGG